MIRLIETPEQCCSCGACSSACPQQAITMTPDSHGTVLPRIDPEKCIDCGLCVRTCHFKGPKLQAPVATYAAQRVSKEKISLSASGGMFAVMAEHIINSGGTVFGCAMPKDNSGNFSPEIVECDSMDRLNDLLGSKYLFSDTGSSYRRVRTLLNQGKTVFYSGLPCQIGGLLGYLRHPYPNLITIDIICHGAPVAPIFNSYIRHLESSKKITVHDFRFRVKNKGWGLYYYYYYYTDRHGNRLNKCAEYIHSIYYRLFLSGAIYRPCCFRCPYAGPQRISDITVGDYWGIEKEHPDCGSIMDFKDGVSSVIVNSPRGAELLQSCRDALKIYPVDYSSIRKYNAQLKAPVRKPADYQLYMDAFARQGYKGIIRCYFRPSRWPHLFKESVGRFVKRKILHIQ